MEKMIWVKQRRGTQQTKPEQRATLRALGLHGIGTQNFIKDSRAIRGMVTRVQHLIDTDLVDATAAEQAQKAKKSDRRGYKLG